MNKKIILFLLIIIGICAISHVSAVDDVSFDNSTDTQILGESDDAEYSAISLDEQDCQVSESDSDKLESVNSDYRNIQDQIDNAEEGSTINLTNKSYVCDYLITVDKSVNIVGPDEGVVIEYNGSNGYFTPFFNINAPNVSLKNIKFVGATFLWAGAVWWSGDNGNLVNCEFTDNYARGNASIGGALVINGDNCNVTNCIFSNNYADLDAGAVLCYGDGSLIRNCEFSDNYALGEKNENPEGLSGVGGALLLYGNNYTVENCNFTKNYCANNGGAIFSYGDHTTIINCGFYGNYVLNGPNAYEGGGAICSAGDALIIDNCTFIGNHAANGFGGALSLCENDTVKNSFFNANDADTGNDIFRGSNIISNIFVLDYGESEKDAIVPEITVNPDDLILNNIFNRTKINSTVEFSAGMIFEYGSSGSIHVTVEGGTIEIENITVLNHPEAKISFSNNVLGVSNLAVGKYTLIVITTPDENHTSVESNLSITVNKATAVIKASKITVALKKSTKWTITIVDSRTGKGIANMKITLKVYTGSKYKTVYVTTNSKGVASYQTKGLTKGTHKIVASATHAGYNFNTLTSSIKVIKQTTLKIKVKKKTMANGASLSITVTNKKTKKPVNGVKLTLLIYTGKTYKKITLKTMKKGKFKGVCGYATNKFSVGTHKVKITPTDIKYAGSAASSMKITKKAKKVPSWETKDTK
ncbi:hypothetical protein [Methanobrevibacter sp.]|uniref:hypothetical protein n=1 Tax=Methanobrevibacter sp. TaxID=66852 RepID=UPI003864B52A